MELCSKCTIILGLSLFVVPLNSLVHVIILPMYLCLLHRMDSCMGFMVQRLAFNAKLFPRYFYYKALKGVEPPETVGFDNMLNDEEWFKIIYAGFLTALGSPILIFCSLTDMLQIVATSLAAILIIVVVFKAAEMSKKVSKITCKEAICSFFKGFSGDVCPHRYRKYESTL